MHIFEIKGFSGLLLFILALLAMVLVLVLLPSAFMMVLWNALLFEAANELLKAPAMGHFVTASFQFPEISVYQGALLWAAAVIVLKLVLNPQIDVQFAQADDLDDLEQQIQKMHTEHEQKQLRLEQEPPSTSVKRKK